MTEPKKPIERPNCPHCGAKMDKWRTPDFGTWSDDYHWVCFNDECSYFINGWKVMEETRGMECSYRHMCGQYGQKTGPLSVPSKDMGKGSILVDEDE